MTGKDLILLIMAIILGTLAAYKLTNTDSRMKEYNDHVCFVNGYQPDCKTPLGK